MTHNGYSITEMLSAFGVSIPRGFNIDDTLSKLTQAPARNAFAIVAGSATAFFVAEKDHNPRVNSVYDALLYTSTCLNVGYSTIHPVTPAGKLIGTFLMTIGPALATRALDGRSQQPSGDVQLKTLQTLQEILTHLQSLKSDPR